MPLYLCPVCGHMPAEHGPEGCMGSETRALVGRIERHRCACRAMIDGELVRGVVGPEGKPETATPTKEKTHMGVMDQINANLPPPPSRMEGNLAGAPDKARLWANKIPFEVTAPPQMRPKPQQFMKPRQDGSMPDPNQWWIPIRLLQWRPSEGFTYLLQDDDEGGKTTVDQIVTLDCNAFRNPQMQGLQDYIQAHGSAGPLRLDKGQAQGQGAPPWILMDWTPADAGYQAPFAPAPIAPAPTAPTPSFAPAPSAPVASEPLSSQGKPYTHFQEHEGKRYGWHDGLPGVGWEEVREAAAPPPFPVTPQPPPFQPMPALGQMPPGVIPPPVPPPGQTAQPIPATKIISGFTRDDQAFQAIETVVADGTQMRQAVYQGHGVVAQPTGIETQNDVGTEPRTRREAGGYGNQAATPPQTPVVAEGGLGVEPVVQSPEIGSPAPYEASLRTTVRQAYDHGQPVAVSTHCNMCLKEYSTPAWYDGKDKAWKQSHQCSKTGRLQTLVVTELVKSAAGVV